jgi:ABC-type multidrug transport system permease subunit
VGRQHSALLGLAAWAIGLAGGIWFALAIAIVFTIVLAGILLYMEDSDGSCGSVGIALYATLEILFAAPLYGWVFWLLGFQADGGIRAALTHCNRSSLK